MYSYML